MGKNKLKKFAEMKTFGCVVECPRQEVVDNDHDLKGKWNGDFFRSSSPIVLELGCGKGEYTVGLARRNPDRNYIGIDIKGARIYTGAKTVETEGIGNAGFLRTEIDLLPSFFAPGEVEEVWITFPDPQMKKVNKRLTGTRFLKTYRRFMRPDGVVNLKTDSPFLYEYTRRLVETNGLPLIDSTDDLYGESQEDGGLPSGDGSESNGQDRTLEREIKTFYERQWLSRGKTIKLLKFRLGDGELVEPDVEDLEPDDYRAMPRFNG